jgi:hypothetical protein
LLFNIIFYFFLFSRFGKTHYDIKVRLFFFPSLFLCFFCLHFLYFSVLNNCMNVVGIFFNFYFLY